jgi:hypothetical protein
MNDIDPAFNPAQKLRKPIARDRKPLAPPRDIARLQHQTFPIV